MNQPNQHSNSALTLAPITTTNGRATGFSGTVLNTLYIWQQRARERQHLHQLSDHMLKDIGLSRVDVLSEANKPFWLA